MQCQTTTSRDPQRPNPPPNYKQAKPQSSPLSRRFAVARALALSTPTCSGLASCSSSGEVWVRRASASQSPVRPTRLSAHLTCHVYSLNKQQEPSPETVAAENRHGSKRRVCAAVGKDQSYGEKGGSETESEMLLARTTSYVSSNTS
jgi:hypothetical protein